MMNQAYEQLSAMDCHVIANMGSLLDDA